MKRILVLALSAAYLSCTELQAPVQNRGKLN